MLKEAEKSGLAGVSFCSSVADERWHDLDGIKSFESWHFDAVSDDGREALVITFYDNYTLSPRFFEDASFHGTSIAIHKFPAVSFLYSRDGKPVLNAVNEYIEGEFRASEDNVGCEIGRSRFELRAAEYGKGHFLTIDVRTRGGRRIQAEIEWVFIESNLLPPDGKPAAAVWNIVAPRADVSGKIKLIGRLGSLKRQIKFRGTGFHDHIRSENTHYRDLRSRMWGRAHFVDTTVVFERHGGDHDSDAADQLCVVRDGELDVYRVAADEGAHTLNRWGLQLPRRVLFRADDQIVLKVRPFAVIRAGFSEVKTLSKITLDLPGGPTRRATGIVEFIDPGRMKYALFRKISDLRIGRYHRPPLF